MGQNCIGDKVVRLDQGLCREASRLAAADTSAGTCAITPTIISALARLGTRSEQTVSETSGGSPSPVISLIWAGYNEATSFIMRGFAMRIGDQLDGRVKRGSEAWAYFYIVLGFVVTLESTVIGMITPLTFPWNILTFLVVAGCTVRAFIQFEWLHHKLIAFKERSESKIR
jgi:hypothetical protein